MATVVPGSVLDQLFYDAHTFSHWQPREVDDETLHKLYELARLCPTSMNSCPARLFFIKTPEAKERLRQCLAPGNIEKTMSAPVCMIVAYDTRFYEYMPTLFPGKDVKSRFENNTQLTTDTAFRNSSLQGAYIILVARALGLDCGPMSGFDADKLNAEFFPDGRYKTNFLINIGYGDAGMLGDRAPRLSFEQACKIL